MPPYIIYSIGFLAQILFSARLIVQWLQSERAGKVLSPVIFWQLSLFASFLLFIYGLLRDDFAIILGQMFTYFIYIRNLKMKDKWRQNPYILRLLAYLIPILTFLYMVYHSDYYIPKLFVSEDIPVAILLWGSLGQIIFTLRFIYQWIYSKRQGESLLPKGFWLISITGSVMILSYAIYRKDPVLFIGQSCGLAVYSRNLAILLKSKK